MSRESFSDRECRMAGEDRCSCCDRVLREREDEICDACQQDQRTYAEDAPKQPDPVAQRQLPK